MNSTIINFGLIERQLKETEDRLLLLSDPEYQSSALEYLDGIVEDREIEVISLDVFDTLLLRNHKSELTRFVETCERICHMMAEEFDLRASPHDALIARFLATRTCYRTGPKVQGCREGTLDEIHKVMHGILYGDDARSNRSIQVELDYEREHLTPNPMLTGFVKRYIGGDRKVILLSDMYLRDEHIEQLTDSLIDGVAFDRIVSSADLKLSKRSGLIYPTLGEEMGVAPSHFLQIGDSSDDYHRAIEQGWNAVRLSIPDSLRGRVRRDHFETKISLESQGVHLGSWLREPTS